MLAYVEKDGRLFLEDTETESVVHEMVDPACLFDGRTLTQLQVGNKSNIMKSLEKLSNIPNNKEESKHWRVIALPKSTELLNSFLDDSKYFEEYIDSVSIPSFFLDNDKEFTISLSREKIIEFTYLSSKEEVQVDYWGSSNPITTYQVGVSTLGVRDFRILVEGILTGLSMKSS